MRRRMRLRTTALPRAFLTLMPKRLSAGPELVPPKNRPAPEVPGGGAVRRRHRLRAEENGKLRARAALPRAVYGFVIGAFQQARGAGKILPRRPSGGGGGSRPV